MFSLVSRKFLAMRNIVLYSVFSNVCKLTTYYDDSNNGSEDTEINNVQIDDWFGDGQ